MKLAVQNVHQWFVDQKKYWSEVQNNTGHKSTQQANYSDCLVQLYGFDYKIRHVGSHCTADIICGSIIIIIVTNFFLFW